MLTLSSALFLPRAESFMLVRKGLPICFIVLTEDAHPAERFAAEELAWHVRKMTGAEIPVRTMDFEQIPESGQAVFIGAGAWIEDERFEAAFADMQLLGDQGYIMKSTRDSEPELLIVAGATPRATLYAVYDLLRQIGVRWYTPEITHFPSVKTIDLGDVELNDLPCFTYRDVSAGGAVVDELWRARLRLNTGYGYLENNLDCEPLYAPIDISLTELLPASHFEDNPEIFPLIGDIRVGDAATRCLSSHMSVLVAADSIEARLMNAHDVNIIRIALPDSLLCECGDCLSLKDSEGAQSALGLSWLNDLAGRLAEAHPRLKFEFPATGANEKPPASLKPHASLLVRLAPDDLNQLRPYEESIDIRTMEFIGHLRGWRALNAGIVVSHPLGSHRYPHMPFPDFKQSMNSIGVYHFEFAEGCMFRLPELEGALVAGHELRTWLLSELAWDRYRDGDSLVREWMRAVYGPAWSAMMDYYKHVQTLAMKPNIEVGVMAAPETFITAKWIDDADRILGRAAARSLTDERVRDSVTKERMGLDMLKLIFALDVPGVSRKKSLDKSFERWKSAAAKHEVSRISSELDAVAFIDSLNTVLR